MKRVIALLASITALLSAGLLHSFYTEYRTAVVQPNQRMFLVSWNAPASTQERFIETFAQRVTTEVSVRYSPHPLPGHENYTTIPYPYRETNPNGSSKIVEGAVFRTEVPGVTLAEGRRLATDFLSSNPLLQGISPSKNTSESHKISQAAMARALWLGIIIPLLLAFISIALLALSARKVPQRGA